MTEPQQQQNSYGIARNIEKLKQVWKKKKKTRVIEFTVPDLKILLQTHNDQ